MLSRFLLLVIPMPLPIPDDYIQAFHWFFFWFNVSDIGQTFGGDAFSPWEYHPAVFARCLRQWKCCPAMPTTTAVRTVWTSFEVAREQHGRVWNWGTPYPPSTKQVGKLMIFQDLPGFRPPNGAGCSSSIRNSLTKADHFPSSTRLSRLWAAENTHPKMKLSIELSIHPNSGWKDTISPSWKADYVQIGEFMWIWNINITSHHLHVEVWPGFVWKKCARSPLNPKD